MLRVVSTFPPSSCSFDNIISILNHVFLTEILEINLVVDWEAPYFVPPPIFIVDPGPHSALTYFFFALDENPLEIRR